MQPVVERMTADVLVVGGGTSGCHAAIAAAQEGAGVVVIDMDGAVGGVPTRANISSYHYGSRGGLQDTVDRRVLSRQKILGGRDTLSHPEAKRSVLSEMLHENKVTVLLNHTAYEVLVENSRVVGVLAAGPEGVKEIRAKVTVDCTSEGDIAAGAGATYTVGREFDGVSHLYSLTPRVIGKHSKTGAPQLAQINFDAGWVHSLSVRDITLAYMEGRSHLLDYLSSAEGTGQHLLSVAPKLGVREGRHIAGDYVLNMDDYLYDRRFDDVVTRSCSHYDTHAKDMGNESDFAQIWLVVLDMFVKGMYWCDVPYRCLLPRGVDGLLVASRALSVDREVSMGVRMQRDIQKTGEAAGVAAAISAARGLGPREVPIQELQRRLLERGVLKPEDLTRSGTTNLTLRTGSLAGLSLSPEYIRGLSAEEGGKLAGQLAAYIGTAEEGYAVWWMLQLGQVSAPAFLQRMSSSEQHAVRRAAAFGLGLTGSKEAVPILMRMLKEREDNRPDHLKPYPKWVSAVIVLRLMAYHDAYDEVLKALEENHSASINSILLQYVYECCPALSAGERVRLIRRLETWLNRPEVGEDYTAQGDRVTVSIKWNMAAWVGLILTRMGEEKGIGMVEPYLHHPRRYVQLAAARGIARMKQLLADAPTTGEVGG